MHILRNAQAANPGQVTAGRAPQAGGRRPPTASRLGLGVSVCTLALVVLAACGDDKDTAPCGGSGNICTLMGTGEAGLGHDGVAPEDVLLYLPQDMVVGADGLLYVLDWNNHRIRTVIDDKVVTVVGTGQLGDAPPGPVLGASLNHPTHLAVSPTGTLVLSAWHNSKVMDIDLANNQLTLLCGTGARNYGGDGGSALTAVLDLPVAAAFDQQGRMYILDQANQRVRRVENGIIDTVVGPPRTYVHIPAGFAQLCADDGSGNPVCQICADTCSACVSTLGDACEAKVFKPQGYAGDGGPATEAFLYLPFGQSAPPAGRMEMGPGDRLFIADTGNQRIRVYDVVTGVIDTVAGSGPATFDKNYVGGYAGDGGPATEALLRRPTDVAVADDGSFYIADTDNHCVRKVDAEGIITTYAGRCGERGFDGDGGRASDALLDRPYGIALGDADELYIADTHNHRVRVVYP